MIKRIIVTKTYLEKVQFDLPMIHQPLLKIRFLSREKVDTDWVLVTSPNAVYDFGNSKVIAAQSCLSQLKKEPEIVLESMKNQDIIKIVDNILKKETLTYLSGEVTSLSFNSHPNLFKKTVYISEYNILDFKPEKGDLVIFWSGLAVKSAYFQNWNLDKVVACSKSAADSLLTEFVMVDHYKLEKIIYSLKDLNILQ